MRTFALSTLVALVPLVGCASTSGREWLSTPLDASAPASRSVAAPNEETVATAPRPRLRHTITLGQSDAAAATDARDRPLASGGGVQVNVHTHVPITVNNHYGYGLGYGYDHVHDPGHDRPDRGRPSPPPLQPGQNFAPPPSYGPTFPFRSAPASPWAR